MKRAAAWMLLALLAGCGGGGGGGNGSPLPSTPAPTPTAAPVAADDWTTYAHDVQRTGLETQATGITSSTVSSLTLAWRNTPNSSCATQAIADAVIVDQASPIVAGGFVYYADACGYVAALSTSTGDVMWHTQLTVQGLGGALGTPTLDAANNLLIVPVHGSDPATCVVTSLPCKTPANGGYLAALNAKTGAVVWTQTPLSMGNLRGEPFVLNGVVYEGLAGGDAFSGAIEGGLFALNEQTGTAIGAIPLFQVAPVGESYDGGGSWSPISTDGTYLYAGTGNTVNNDGLQDSVVQFNPQTQQVTPNFQLTAYDGKSADEDVGGGEMIYDGDLYFEGKNGKYYGYVLDTPSVPFADIEVNTNSQAGDGAIWTPTTDGNVVAVSSGYNTKTPQFSSVLHIFTIGSDADRCDSIEATYSALYSYAAFVSGVGFTGLDNDVPTGTPDGGTNGPAPEFVAFGDNCKVLWEATQTDILAFFYGGPAVVPSGVYAIDDMGNVYAWKLPSATTSSKTRSLVNKNGRSLIRPGVRSTVRSTLYMRRASH